ncbi:NRAMP family divalent metal transporter [Flavihumibacter solisilvae]|uniref:Membrane protein n=1 Tax=Flavihumibacter solisilvae TaxID=1349421 RepID=A0A0C1LA72_9BACT|nr:NRAMP family divalent metal transporter [Flavihumibacter solisilvae]KIC96411.1 membrane protein [Flavihumibacter solisilvae]
MNNRSLYRSAFWGAAFLMATSAIGPGFLTQTAVFTEKLVAAFGFSILVSIIIDVIVQLNIWRIILSWNKPAQQIANELFPGLGFLLSLMILLGGLAFNIGNVAGAGLGLNVITGMDTRICALISAAAGIILMLVKDAAKAMDRFVQLLGVLMIGLTCYVAIVAAPPIGKALAGTFWPEVIDWKSIVTIVGGTVGGYICFAGAHRLLEAKLPEEQRMRSVSSAAIRGVITVSVMRYVLFLAALGVVCAGLTLDKGNPAAAVFRHAAGDVGYRLFGIVLWSAAITSVIGSAYTSVSFIRSWHPLLERYHKQVLVAFISVSTIVFLLVGQPVKLLITAGMINGFILPFSLFILIAANLKSRKKEGYQHPAWLSITGLLVALLLTWIAIQVLIF